MMKIVVLLKQTFDTEEKIIVTPEGVDERGAKFVINPYDEYALEEAIRLREQHGGQVIVVTCGPERSQEALRTALAIGADEAIRLENDDLPDDSSAIAAALAALIEPLGADLVLAGLFAVDSGSGSVALQVAQWLGLPHATAVMKLSILSRDALSSLPPAEFGNGGEGELEAGGLGADWIGAGEIGAERYALVERDVEGDTETVSIPLPALLTAQQGLNEPRYPSLPGIMKAKRKPLRVVTLEELLGGGGSKPITNLIVPARTVRTQLLPPPPRAIGQQLKGNPQTQASTLIELLQTEAKLF